MKPIDELKHLAKVKLGEGAPIEAVIELLAKEGAITPSRALRIVVRHEFYRLLADPHTMRTAHDIEQELSARYDIADRTVRRMRNKRT